jgi:hypothetical protein
MPWLVQYEVEAPVVLKKSANTFQISFKDEKKIKQLAILQEYKENFEVEVVLPNDTRLISLSALEITRKPNTQYWIVSIGKQNQLSKLVALP